MQPDGPGVQNIPLFPLRTVLFRGGRLPLKIFEPRYVDMVSRCLKDGDGFGVVLIREGAETHTTQEAVQPRLFGIGTHATIVDFSELPGGVLGIMTAGGRKFRVLETAEQDDHLLVGEVEFLPEERQQTLTDEHQPLIDILHQLLEHPMVKRLDLDIDFTDARAVSWALADLLPIEPEIKQSLLQMQLPRERLAELRRLVANMRGSGTTDPV
jgi:Lon protease-like protein